MTAISRRKALVLAAGAVVTGPALLANARQAIAADNKLDPEGAQAKALAYVHDTPNPEQTCANCNLYSGEPGSEWGPCTIFPGSSVSANGWCKAWVVKIS